MKNLLIKSIIVLFTFLFVGNLTVSANTIDFSKKGNIEISVLDSEDSTGIENVEVSIYKIAAADKENNNLVYKNLDELNACAIDLSTITETNITESLISCVKENTSSITKNTNSDGIATFDNLELGLYLIIQSNKVVGYSSFDPFLIALPQINNNKWVYDVKAMPKTDVYKVTDITVNKVWNSEGKSIPSSIAIELINNNEVIDTVVLSEKNEWTFTWNDMPLNDKYSVREKEVPADYIVTYMNEGFNYTVTNTRKLPQTGERTWIVNALVISGILSLIVGLTLNKRNENN